MAKVNEIDYVQDVARVDGAPLEDFKSYLLNKPFSASHGHEYLMDAAQTMSLLPPAPAKILDVGVGSASSASSRQLGHGFRLWGT
jgi:hypothetical protein